MITVSSIEALMREARWDQAQRACRDLLLRQPTDPKLHLLEGICGFRRGDYASAETSFGRAGALDPFCLDAGIKQCQCLERLQRYDEAVYLARTWQARCGEQPILRQIVRSYEGRADFLRAHAWSGITRGEYAW